MLVSCVVYSSTPKIELICSSEMSVDFHRVTRRFPVSEIQLFHSTVPKLLIDRYYVLFLIPLFIVQMTKLVQFTVYRV
jgi:hypothetical protein